MSTAHSFVCSLQTQTITSLTATAYTYPSSQESGAWTYVLSNHLGSVRQQVNAAGQVTLTQIYNPFGVLFETTKSGASPFGYTRER